jgi:hypothetical protein
MDIGLHSERVAGNEVSCFIISVHPVKSIVKLVLQK